MPSLRRAREQCERVTEGRLAGLALGDAPDPSVASHPVDRGVAKDAQRPGQRVVGVVERGRNERPWRSQVFLGRGAIEASDRRRDRDDADRWKLAGDSGERRKEPLAVRAPGGPTTRTAGEPSRSRQRTDPPRTPGAEKSGTASLTRSGPSRAGPPGRTSARAEGRGVGDGTGNERRRGDCDREQVDDEAPPNAAERAKTPGNPGHHIQLYSVLLRHAEPPRPWSSASRAADEHPSDATPDHGRARRPAPPHLAPMISKPLLRPCFRLACRFEEDSRPNPASGPLLDRQPLSVPKGDCQPVRAWRKSADPSCTQPSGKRCVALGAAWTAAPRGYRRAAGGLSGSAGPSVPPVPDWSADRRSRGRTSSRIAPSRRGCRGSRRGRTVRSP